MIISFVYPKFLLLLFLIPVFVFIYFFSFFYNKKRAVNFPNFQALERISDIELFSKGITSLYIGLGILILIVLGISGTLVSFNARSSMFSYVIAIDSSGSMKTTDILPNRMEAAKNSAQDLVNKLPVGTEMGVLSFAGNSEIIHELDTAKIRVNAAIDSISAGEIQGTNIYSAVIGAGRILAGKQLKAVVLISDGQINLGEFEDIISYSKLNNIIINTIAVGSSGITEAGTVSIVDEEFLKSVAAETGGSFFRVQDINDFGDAVEVFSKSETRKVSVDVSVYLLIAALILFIINWALYNFRFKSVP